MPSHRFWLPGVVVVATVAGCTDEPPSPKISALSVAMRWEPDDRRSIEISIVNPDIPCTETESSFVGESPVECKSAPWSLSVDGFDLVTSPVVCWSAYDGLFGHENKRCSGGQAKTLLNESAGADVDIVAISDSDETRVVLRGVRQTYHFVQETGFDSGQPAVVRVDGLDLESDSFAAVYSRSTGVVVRDSALPGEDASRLHLSPYNLEPGLYNVRVLALAAQGPLATIAVPIEGGLTVGP
jgi:hypothetical protein